MPGLPGGTVTFLFTDIEGSTRLLQQLGEDEYAKVLADQRRLLRFAFQAHRGHEVETQGDAFFFAFPQAKDALAAAIIAQRDIIAHSWPVEGSVHVRMGLHTGKPLRAETGYVGMDVHRAARICAAGNGGQILLSQSTRDAVEKNLHERVTLQDLGEHRLKDLHRPEHLFQALHPELPSQFPPLRSLSVLPHNLPIQLTSFVGREREMVEVNRLLSITHLLTLTGAGGCGKTRLALRVGAGLLDQFRDGVWLVDLASLSDAELVPRTVASAFHLREQPDRGILATLIDYLQPKELLMILDNCEHLLSACAHLSDSLLRASPGLRILATSREDLGVAGELVYRVPSLSVPDPNRIPDLGTLVQQDAVRLFLERARFALPTFEITQRNARPVVELCRRLDGIPLAIELAAMRVRAISPRAILARLDDRFRLLTGGSQAALPRHQTLLAAMDWSYDLLSEKERVLLQRLSVFAGGFTPEAVEAICAEDGLDHHEVLDLLSHLVDVSLVLAEEQDGGMRYRLLETVRQYAQDRLLESEEPEALRGRHLSWYLAMAENAARQSRGPNEKIYLDLLEGELDNLRSALDWALRNDDVESGLLMAGTLRPLWYDRGYLIEGRRWLEAFLSRSNHSPMPARAKALLASGTLARRQGDTAAARPLLEQALEISRRLGDKQGIARSLNWLASLAASRGDLIVARSFFDESLVTWREIGDKAAIGYVLSDLGEMLLGKDPTEARTVFEESLELLRESEWKEGIAVPLVHLAGLAATHGNLTRARMLAEESLALSREMGHRELVSTALSYLGRIAAAEGDYDRAQSLLEERLAIERELGSKSGTGFALTELGSLAQSQRDQVRARSLLEESLKLAQEINSKELMASSQIRLGHLAKTEGDLDRAADLYKKSLKLVVDLGNRVGLPPCLEGLAAVVTTKEQWGRAARLFGVSETLRVSLGIPVPPFNRPDRERNIQLTRAAMGEEAFMAAWAEGQAMKPEQAIEYAARRVRVAPEEPKS